MCQISPLSSVFPKKRSLQISEAIPEASKEHKRSSNVQICDVNIMGSCIDFQFELETRNTLDALGRTADEVPQSSQPIFGVVKTVALDIRSISWATSMAPARRSMLD